MFQPPAHESMTLAGLAAANGPWLCVRLQRLAEHSGLALSEAVVQGAVAGTSAVLGQILNAEGRPALAPNASSDPAVRLGAEQAGEHMQAGLSMPASLKVQRLLRRAYDDLVRESWVEKETRARAHEDVERFFERQLVGLVSAWTGQGAPAPGARPAEQDRAAQLAQREEELKRALEAAQKLTLALRQAKEQNDALQMELAQSRALLQDQESMRQGLAQARGAQRELESLRQELAQAKAQLAQAQEQISRQRELEARLADQDQLRAQLSEQDALRAQLAEIKEQAALSLTGLKEQLGRLKEQAGQSLANMKAEFAQAQAEAQEQAREEQQALTARIRDLESERAGLGARLAEMEMALAAHGDAETSRLEAQKEIERSRAEADRARQKADRAREELRKLKEDAQDLRMQSERLAIGVQAEADRLREELRQLREAHAALSSEAEAMRARLSEAGSRLSETQQAEDEEIRASMAQAAEALAQAQARIARAEADREGFAARLKEAEAKIVKLAEALKRAKAELAATGQKAAQKLQGAEGERLDLAARLKQAEAQVIQLTEELAQAQTDLAAAQTSGRQASVQAQTLQNERLDLAARLKTAETQVIRLSEELSRLRQQGAQAGADSQQARKLAEQQLAEARTRLAELTAAGESASRLLSAHLALTPDAVAALDASGGFSAWNQRFLDLFGFSDADLANGLEAVLPQMASHLLRPEGFLGRLRELRNQPAQAEQGLPLTTSAGKTLVFRSAPAGGAGRLLGFSDVSLEHDMESLVREIEGITRYELGQALTSFIHLPQELMDEPGVTPAQAQKLAVIRDSGYRIVNTVNMAVDLFRMERGMFRMPPGRSLDLAVVARRAAKDLLPLASSRHVNLELLLDASPLPQDCALPAPGDPILAHALAVNLLRDALEAAPRQSVVSAVLRQDQDGLRFSVHRQGGLTPAEATAYFDKPQGEDADYGLRRGRHAALLITRSLGGALSLSSSPQGGTTLELRLPR